MMKILKISLIIACFLLVSQFMELLPNQEINLEIQIFKIPRLQSMVRGGSAKGGIIGTQKGGDVTASFSDGVVLIEIGSYKNKSELSGMIKKRIAYNSPMSVRIFPLVTQNMVFKLDSLKAQQIRGELYQVKGSITEYWLKASPVSVNDEEIVIKLEFILSKSQVTGNKAISEGYKKKLLDHTFGVKFDKALMIGFPAGESGPRGPFFWLALFVDHWN